MLPRAAAALLGAPSRVTRRRVSPLRVSLPSSVEKMSPPDAAPEILDSEDDGAFNDDGPSLELSVAPQQLQTVASDSPKDQHGLESSHVPTSGGMFHPDGKPGCLIVSARNRASTESHQRRGGCARRAEF
jgi:hypothetical protein